MTGVDYTEEALGQYSPSEAAAIRQAGQEAIAAKIAERAAKVTRHGRYIRIRYGITALEGMEGNMPTLAIQRRGKTVRRWRGSSLYFSAPLTSEDKGYLYSLATGIGAYRAPDPDTES